MSRPVQNHSAMRTPGSDEALALIRTTGMNQSEAIRWALSLGANILQHAWVNGYETRGKVPEIQVAFKVKEVQ